ncbi:MAG: endoglucanase [Deltaproteobacteria bacterium]|nr:endoglucanase [Deltaproteobacteria bacterium]
MRSSSALTGLLLLTLWAMPYPVYAETRTNPGPFFGAALDGYPLTLERLHAVENDLGLTPSLIVFFLQWPATPETGHFPAETLRAVEEFGALPCLTWEPMYIQDGHEHAVLAQRILDGEYDPFLRDFARAAQTHGQPFLIRLAHEMNLSRYHWGTTAEAYGPESPGLYRRMFRHVVDIFRQKAADNVLFVFCPNAESVPHPVWTDHGAWNTASAYYPGHDVVDILGMDGYNWGTTQNRAEHGWDSSFRSFADIMGPIREELTILAPDKPLVVFETASTDRGGDKNLWIRDAVKAMKDWALAGFVWFEADKEVDWRLATGTDPSLIDFLKSDIDCRAAQVIPFQPR